jgi:tetratricopeptide (TPR) repeat protein
VAQDSAGNLTAALADYGEALKHDPGLAPAYNNRANIARRSGHFADAKRDYQAALDCPEGAREYPYLGLGLIAQAEGTSEAARDFFRKALAANPAFTQAAAALAAMEAAAKNQINAKIPDKLAGDKSVTSKPVIAKPAIANAAGDPKPSTKAGARALIQLGAFGNEALAAKAWGAIAAAYPQALKGLAPLTVAVEVPGKGRLWRLRTAVTDKAAARSVCAALSEHGQACVPVP